MTEHKTPSNPEPQQPSTRELIATVRESVAVATFPYSDSGNAACLRYTAALTELEKRIGGE